MIAKNWGLVAVIILLGLTGCKSKRIAQEQQSAQLQLVNQRLDEINSNLATLSESRLGYASAPMINDSLSLQPDANESMVQITDFGRADNSRKAQVSRLGQSTPTGKSSGRGVATGKYKKNIAISGLSVNDVQRALKNAGFNPGTIDGKLGPKTVAAIKQFQRTEGLSADGVVGRRTWDKLSKHMG